MIGIEFLLAMCKATYPPLSPPFSEYLRNAQNTYIKSLRFESKQPFSETSSNLRRITWIFLEKISNGGRAWRLLRGSCVPGPIPELPLLTWPGAHSLWHAGQRCFFPFLEQSVVPEHWGKSTSAHGCLRVWPPLKEHSNFPSSMAFILSTHFQSRENSEKMKCVCPFLSGLWSQFLWN